MLAAVGAGAVLSTTPASAAAKLTLCSYGNYSAYATLPQQGGFATYTVAPGHCSSINVSGSTTYAKVYGLWNTHPNDSFFIVTAHFDGAQGVDIYVSGTTTDPSSYYQDGGQE